MQNATDAELVERLEQVGLNEALASRLATWLPHAFAAHLLRSRWPAPLTFTTGSSSEQQLTSDPVYVACMERAQRMIRPEAEAIASRSALMNWANEHPDRPPTRIELDRPFRPLNDVRLLSPATLFRALIAAHTSWDPPFDFGATVHPVLTSQTFRVEVDFWLDDSRVVGTRVTEPFAGQGATWPEALHDAGKKFESGSIHPIVAGLINETLCADQVEWETWADAGGPRRVCLGPMLVLYSRVEIDLAPVLERLKQAFKAVPASSLAHSFRVFIAHNGDQNLGTEAILDGAPWPAGLEALNAFDWPTSNPVWGVRLFGIVAPA